MNKDTKKYIYSVDFDTGEVEKHEVAHETTAHWRTLNGEIFNKETIEKYTFEGCRVTPCNAFEDAKIAIEKGEYSLSFNERKLKHELESVYAIRKLNNDFLKKTS